MVMSKSIGKAVGAVATGGLSLLGKTLSNGTKVSYDGAPAEDYARYLTQYDTSKVDKTLSNLQDYAVRQSQNLGNMNYNMPEINQSDWNIPQVRESDWNFNTANQDWYMPEVNKSDWTFNVNASDEAKQQAQDATYNAYMDRLNPQFERQTADYATMLQQKGIPVGSEAYSRAMSDLQDRQNAAVNQAAYQSVLAGQDAYTQDLQNQIAAGNFGNNATNSYYNAQLAANTARDAYANALLRDNEARAAFYNAQAGANDARTGYINAQNAVNNAQAAYMGQILAALGDAPTEYDIQGDIYAARANKAANEYAARQQTVANRLGLVNGLLGAIGKAGGAMAGGAGGAA